MSESEQQTSTPTTGGESSADQPNVKKNNDPDPQTPETTDTGDFPSCSCNNLSSEI